MTIPVFHVEAPFRFWCDGETHSFENSEFTIFGFPCDCYKGTLEDCPRCGGSGVIAVNDGDGHREEMECPNHHRKEGRS